MGSFTTYSLPVSRRTHSRYGPLDRSTARSSLCHEASAPRSRGKPLVSSQINRKRYEKGTALVAAYSPRLKRIGIQNWRRASTVAGMSRQAFDAQRGVAKGIAGRPASSTQWNRIGRSR